MDRIINYFKKIGWKRFVVMIIGNIFLSMGVSLFKFAGLGNDPYSGMVMALSDVAGIPFANFLILANIAVFTLEIVFGREFIGAGTIINALFVGYMITFFYNLFCRIFTTPENLMVQLITVLIGTIVTGLGVSLYQTPNVGASPYDSLSLIMAKRIPKISYFWHRICTDAICVIVCFLTGGIVGLGTLISAFGFGPVIDFFNIHFTRKLFKGDENII
ncbi:MAG: hypothetical protein PUD93_10890 [Lachnospiraceae bacterium]|nr:hypothetical protein [Lachnospiraceae bacterium]